MSRNTCFPRSGLLQLPLLSHLSSSFQQHRPPSPLSQTAEDWHRRLSPGAQQHPLAPLSSISQEHKSSFRPSILPLSHCGCSSHCDPPRGSSSHSTTFLLLWEYNSVHHFKFFLSICQNPLTHLLRPGCSKAFFLHSTLFFLLWIFVSNWAGPGPCKTRYSVVLSYNM